MIRKKIAYFLVPTVLCRRFSCWRGLGVKAKCKSKCNAECAMWCDECANAKHVALNFTVNKNKTQNASNTTKAKRNNSCEMRSAKCGMPKAKGQGRAQRHTEWEREGVGEGARLGHKATAQSKFMTIKPKVCGFCCYFTASAAIGAAQVMRKRWKYAKQS